MKRKLSVSWIRSVRLNVSVLLSKKRQDINCSVKKLSVNVSENVLLQSKTLRILQKGKLSKRGG